MPYNYKHCIDSYIPFSDIIAIQAHLIQQYQGAISCVQVMPLDEEEGLPVRQIYGSVLVEEDLTALKKTRRPDEETGNKTVDSITDIFYARNKLTRIIVLKGEAGHGKTVFCLKLIDTWSKGKQSAIANKKHSGDGTNSKHQSCSRHINQEQVIESISATKCLNSRGNFKQLDSSPESKTFSNSRLVRLLTSLKQFAKSKKQNHSKSVSQARGGKRGGCLHPSLQQHSVDDMSESKLRQSSELLIPKQRNKAHDDCTSQQDNSSKFSKVLQRQMDDNEKLQSCLSVFEMVFYVPLRHARQGISSVVELVCDSVSVCDKRVQQNIRKVLSDNSIPCLVIIDGLDEWRAPGRCRVEGFPDRDGLVNCSLLCTTRPWRMVSLRLGLDSTCDKVVQILGLKNDSIETVINNILVNFYGLKISSDLYKEKFEHFCQNTRLPELKSLMKIPLILTSSCLVWNEEDDTSKIYQANSYFMTFFYLKLQEVTITRAENKHGIVKSFLDEKRQNYDRSLYVPSILLRFEPIIDFIEILKPVGRLALQDLLSDETHLVFPRNKLEREIGKSKVELALKAGILSQTKAQGLSYQQRVSLSFYHKSIQEFIAALYMTCCDTEASTLFRTHCNTVDNVMELSNMIMFVCGLDPVVGCQLSEHVRDVVKRDVETMQYREVEEDKLGLKKVEALYKIQCKWFCEMKQNLSYTHNTDHTHNLRVTDVYLAGSDSKKVSVASELVSMEDNSIMSVCLHNAWYPVHSIIQHLPGCKNLSSLHITNITDTHSKELLTEVLPQLVQLQRVVYGYGYTCGIVEIYYLFKTCPPVETAVVRAVRHLPSLRHIELWDITLSETVTLPSQLQTAKLVRVEPAHFILPSVCRCTQLICIKLENITLTDTVTLPTQLQKVELRDIRSAHFILTSLSGCHHLTSLFIEWHLTMKDCEVLVSVLPQLSHLQYIDYSGSDCDPAGHAAVVSALQHLTQLTHIELANIDLRDVGTLLVTPHMTELQKVKLWDVKMSFWRWMQFLSSLHRVQHTVHVTLNGTNIDGATVETIHNSPHFTVTKEERHPWKIRQIYEVKDEHVYSMKFHTVATVDLHTQ